jgi:chromate reductase
MAADTVKILGLSGSLRKDSYNSSALRAAQQLVPQGAALEIFDKLRDIPLFDQDQEKDQGPAVADLKARVRKADAILFVTPEYNYSIPGVLKNAIDCASRPYGDSAWKGKPVAIMGASVGMLGSARAQYHLRQCFVFLEMHPVNQPEVMISKAADRFDAQGHLTDATSRELIQKLLVELVAWTRHLATRQKG